MRGRAIGEHCASNRDSAKMGGGGFKSPPSLPLHNRDSSRFATPVVLVVSVALRLESQTASYL
jgi:hypothetical protein